MLDKTQNLADTAASTSDEPARDAKSWAQMLARYRSPSIPRSLFEVGITVGPLAVLWVLIWLTLDIGYWLSLLLAVPAAFFLVRAFMIQHDCGHGSFFRNRHANDWTGRILGVLTLTPYDTWRKTHAIHHANSGNLNQRGIGDVDTLTVREYLAKSRWGRLGYRLYRHPAVMFGLGPTYLFLLQQRLPLGLMTGNGWRPWISTMATNAAIAAIVATLMWFMGVKAFLLVHLPVMIIGASIGVWLFYVQHQFEETLWDREPNWNMHEAALHGSSHYDLPLVLRWLTANIGAHHIHHLCARIPYYRLSGALRDYPELKDVGRLTLLESFRCVPLVLWDEGQRRLVSFQQLRRNVKASKAQG